MLLGSTQVVEVIRKDHQGRWYFMRPDGRAIPRYGYQPDDMIDEGLGDGRNTGRGVFPRKRLNVGVCRPVPQTFARSRLHT